MTRILEALVAGAPIDTPFNPQSEAHLYYQRNIYEMARLSTRFDRVSADCVAELNWGIDSAFARTADPGVCRPPLNGMWMEGKYARRGALRNLGAGWTQISAFGAFIVGKEGGFYIAPVFLDLSERRIIAPGATVDLKLTDDGTLADKDFYINVDERVADEDKMNAIGLMTRILGVCPTLYALRLMNCVNVHLEPEPRPSPKLERARRRRGRPPSLRWQRIVLPAPKHGGSHRNGSPADNALHQVRGHFKTYTPEAPLFGRIVGQYWWGPQMRGNAERGEVKHEYVLEG